MGNTYNYNSYQGSSRTMGYSKSESNQRDNKISFPKNYLDSGYFDSNGIIRKELLLKTAENFGKTFTQEIASKRTSYNKIRGFFDEVVTVKESIGNGVITPKEGVAKLEQIISRVYKRCDSGTVSVYFRDFITTNIEHIADLTDDKEIKKNIVAFTNHYEAVIGFTSEKARR